jgi:putative ABC transport system substrate-binding protein
MTFEPGIAGKWCSMLKELYPQIKRAAFMANPEIKTYEFYLRAAQTPATALAIELVPRPVKSAAEITNVLEEFARVPDSGLIVPPDVFTVSHGDLIIALAAQHRLPAVYAFGNLVSAGGLMSYGTDRVDEMRQAASYIDRILRGDNPADLPVQAPTKFETVVNLKTATALGITVPTGLLLAADEVIE